MPGAFVLAAGLLVLPACTSGASSSPPSPAGSTSTKPAMGQTSVHEPGQYAAQVVRGTNAVRVAQRLPPLQSSACARKGAILRAAALAGKAGLTHAPMADILTVCVPYGTAAENLSRTGASPATVLAAWMRSPGHRSNLLDPDLTEMGVGCLRDGLRMLCSQVFLGP